MKTVSVSPGLADEAREYIRRHAHGGTIILDTIPGNTEENELARQELRKLKDVKIKEFNLPSRFVGPVMFPLIRDREGSYPRAQGLDEIKMFIAAILAVQQNGSVSPT
jgi:hypothetical protein